MYYWIIVKNILLYKKQSLTKSRVSFSYFYDVESCKKWSICVKWLKMNSKSKLLKWYIPALHIHCAHKWVQSSQRYFIDWKSWLQRQWDQIFYILQSRLVVLTPNILIKKSDIFLLPSPRMQATAIYHKLSCLTGGTNYGCSPQSKVIKQRSLRRWSYKLYNYIIIIVLQSKQWTII